MNVLAEKIYQSEIANPHSEISLDISEAGNGVYFVEVTTEKGIERKKIVKQ